MKRQQFRSVSHSTLFQDLPIRLKAFHESAGILKYAC